MNKRYVKEFANDMMKTDLTKETKREINNIYGRYCFGKYSAMETMRRIVSIVDADRDSRGLYRY